MSIWFHIYFCTMSISGAHRGQTLELNLQMVATM